MVPPTLIAGLELFRATDREQCGIILRRKKKLRVVEVPNVAIENDDYAIRESDLQKVRRALFGWEEVIGFIHTHLPHHAATPSEVDLLGARIYPDFKNAVYKPSTKELTWYSGDSGEEEVGPVES